PGQLKSGLVLNGQEVDAQTNKSMPYMQETGLKWLIDQNTGTSKMMYTDETAGVNPITPTDPCATKPPVEVVRFRIYAEVRADDGGPNTYSFPFNAPYLEVSFSSNCLCDIKWNFTQVVDVRIDIDDIGNV